MLDESIRHLGVLGHFVTFILFLMGILLANTADTDHMPHNVVSDQGLHFLQVSR